MLGDNTDAGAELETRRDRSGSAERGERIENARVLIMEFVLDNVTPAHGHVRVLGEEKRLKSCPFDSRCQLGDANAAVGHPDRNAQLHRVHGPDPNYQPVGCAILTTRGTRPLGEPGQPAALAVRACTWLRDEEITGMRPGHSEG